MFQHHDFPDFAHYTPVLGVLCSTLKSCALKSEFVIQCTVVPELLPTRAEKVFLSEGGLNFLSPCPVTVTSQD